MILKNPPSLVIVFEGLDGSGKSTQAKLLAEEWRCYYLSTSKLSYTPKGIEQRRSAYMKNNKQASIVMQKKSTNKPVIVDRYIASTTASFQAYFSTYPIIQRGWRSYYPTGFTIPTIVVNIELDEEERLSRLLNRGEYGDTFEQRLAIDEEYRNCVKAWLQAMSTITIDATSLSIEELHSCIISNIWQVI